MEKFETVKKYTILVAGLFFMGLGVALTKCAGLGLSTISSVPNVLSIKFSFMSLGSWLAFWNYVMIAVQILILRRGFKLVQLLQIPVSFVFGYFTDLGVWLFSRIPMTFYPLQLVLAAAGVVILGFGISFTIISGKVMNPGEALVKVIADKTHKDFGNMKIAFDFFCVALAAMLSMLFFDMKVVGIREGTVIAMLGTGLCVKLFCRILSPLFK